MPVYRVFLVSTADDELVLVPFAAAFAEALRAAGHDPARFDVGFARQPPTGPGIVGLAVAPPVQTTAAHVAALPDLRVVAAAAAGYDHVDMAAVRSAGAHAVHAPGYCDIEVADHALAMTALLLRNLHTGDAHVRSGGWSPRAVGAISGIRIRRLRNGRPRDRRRANRPHPRPRDQQLKISAATGAADTHRQPR